MKKGSISIFSLLIMMLIASALFALLEAARYQEICRLSDLQTQIALESAFANYDVMLWEKYGLLGSALSQFEENAYDKANAKAVVATDGMNLLGFKADALELAGYTLMTDGEGEVFEQAVATTMQNTIGYGMAKELFNQYEAIKFLQGESEWSSSWLDSGLLQDLEVEEEINNPMTEAKQLQSKGILELVIEDMASISGLGVNTVELVSARGLSEGRNPQITQNDWLDKVLLQQYILGNLSNYCNTLSSQGLKYQVEYVIGGKGSDIENLKLVVTDLLLLREMINFLYLTTNPVKMEEAGVIALALAGISVNPVVIEIVKMGIIAAWAFGESVLDVRALLQGKKIPLLKSDMTWTLELEQIGNITQGYPTAKASENGLSYENYLGVLLLFKQEKALAMHTMDVQEVELRSQVGYGDFRMDEILVQATISVDYVTAPIFLTFYQLENSLPQMYKHNIRQGFSYY